MPRKGKGSKAEAQGARGGDPIAQTTATGQEYGMAAQQERAMDAVPMARQPGDRGSFARPTERPDQPVTEGAPFGPGRGQDILRLARPTPQTSSHMPALEKAAMLTHSPVLMDILRRSKR